MNNLFIQALKEDKLADELAAIREEIKATMTEMKALDKIRSSIDIHDKDSLPAE